LYDPAAGSVFTLDGEPLQGPAPRPLDPFPLVVAGDRIEVGTRAVCPSELVQRPAWCGGPLDGPRALPAGQAAVLVPPGGWVRVLSEPGLRAGAEPARRVMENELRAWGFEVVHTRTDLERLSAAGARVLWIHRDALDWVDREWARAQYANCHAIGVLDGTVADLVGRFGLGENSGGWTQPGGTRPAFAQVRVSCPTSMSHGQTSDWLTLGWLLGSTRSALSDPNDPAQNVHDLEVTNHVDEEATIQINV
jgi:hypothetical protein